MLLLLFVCRRKNSTVSFWNQFPEFDFNPVIARQTLVLSVVFVGMITFNNICLQYVEVSFYNVARSLTIVFNVVLTYILLNETTSLRTCATLLVVVLGFVVRQRIVLLPRALCVVVLGFVVRQRIVCYRERCVWSS